MKRASKNTKPATTRSSISVKRTQVVAEEKPEKKVVKRSATPAKRSKTDTKAAAKGPTAAEKRIALGKKIILQQDPIGLHKLNLLTAFPSVAKYDEFMAALEVHLEEQDA